MKTLKITVLMVCMLMLSTNFMHAQDQNESKIYRVHEDQVKLTMVSEYESIVKEMVALIEKHKLPDLALDHLG